MILLQFYRLYGSLAVGAGLFLLAGLPWWLCLLCAAGARVAWHFIEKKSAALIADRNFTRRIYDFKQRLGPYGIRMANKAENDPGLRRSLAEVFTSNEKKLKKSVDQLEVMDTLFRAGMRPDADSYHLHDLKFKYGKLRLEEIEKKKAR